MRSYKASDKAIEKLRATASKNPEEAAKAQKALVQAYQNELNKAIEAVAKFRNGEITAKAAFNEQTPLRRAVFREDTIGNIYTRLLLAPGAQARFPLDFVAEGEQNDFVAFTMPKQGYVPENHIEGDEIYVNTFRIANSIDWDLAYARDARWDVIEAALDVFRSGFVKRLNDDGWHVILASALSTGELVEDPLATAGVFTKELVSRMKTRQYRRTLNGDLTDIYVSPEAFEDIRGWNPAVGTGNLSDITQHDIYLNQALDDQSNPVIRIYGVNIRQLRELGDDSALGAAAAEYQDFYLNDLGGSLGGSGDLEICIGLDLSKQDSFVMPIREEMQMFDDPMLHRQGRAGVYGWMEPGFAALDNRRVIPGSF